MENSKVFPLIDISPFVEHSSHDDLSRHNVLEQVTDACLRHGFFIIQGHSINADLQQKVLEYSRAFFNLPREEKDAVSEKISFGRSHRGYTAIQDKQLQQEKAAELKEGFQMGVEKPINHPDCQAERMLTGPNVWPQSLEPEFSSLMTEYCQKMYGLQDKMMEIIALSLGVGHDVFGAFCNDSLRHLRLLHYPPQEDLNKIGAGAHTDFGALTCLLTDGVSGLQVMTEGQWVGVDAPPGTYIVNLGDMMKRMTSSLYQSSIHRVVNVSGRHRYSVPMFLEGNLNFIISPVVDGPCPPADRLTVEEHMMERFRTVRDHVEAKVATGY